MTARPTSVLLAPPLSAYGAIASMTLYLKNLGDAFAALREEEADFTCTIVSPPAEWRSSSVRRRICQRIVLPRLIRREQARASAAGRDARLHVLDPHYAHLLPRRGRGSVTCHDLDALVSPGRGFAKAEERWRLRQIVRAGAIHAISGNTARDVARFFPAKAAAVITNHYGLTTEFHRRPVPAAAPHLAPLRAAAGCVFVLHVGSNIERKNIPVLLRGFALAKARLAGRRLKLVKVGDALHRDGFGPRLDELGIAGDLIHLGSLGIEPLVDVYNACTIFAFPSRYEGFGRPVLEAQACGLPCVLADSSSLPEVGGTAALYHPTEDAARLADRIVEFVEHERLRERAIAAGLANALQFTWRRHAEIILRHLIPDRLATVGAV
jgi:glycosyltransferase involved in cell wall biosynthesis